MSDTTTARLALPLLPLDDTVVLPGMVVPVRLAGDGTDDARRAVESAQAAQTAESAESSEASDSTAARVVLAPRLEGRWPSVGAEGVIEQVGRLPGGELAAIVRVVRRVRIGAGVTGPGSALWVEVERPQLGVGGFEQVRGLAARRGAGIQNAQPGCGRPQPCRCHCLRARLWLVGRARCRCAQRPQQQGRRQLRGTVLHRHPTLRPAGQLLHGERLC